jgi:hypothetical protein
MVQDEWRNGQEKRTFNIWFALRGNCSVWTGKGGSSIGSGFLVEAVATQSKETVVSALPAFPKLSLLSSNEAIAKAEMRPENYPICCGSAIFDCTMSVSFSQQELRRCSGNKIWAFRFGWKFEARFRWHDAFQKNCLLFWIWSNLSSETNFCSLLRWTIVFPSIGKILPVPVLWFSEQFAEIPCRKIDGLHWLLTRKAKIPNSWKH